MRCTPVCSFPAYAQRDTYSNTDQENTLALCALHKLGKGEAVDPSEYYFRKAPFFETGSDKYGWLNRIAAVITSQGNGAVCCAMIGTVAGKDLVFTSIEASDLDSILIGFRAAKSKECLL